MSVKKSLENRKSAMSFNTNKEVKEKVMTTILNAGVLAPNSMGLEAWKFYVLKNDKVNLMKACPEQTVVYESDFAVIVVAPTTDTLKHERVMYEQRMTKKGIKLQKVEFFMDALLKRNSNQYLREQTFFAANSMILQAEELGVDSVIIGSYNTADIASVIGVDESKYQICSVICFGYSNESHVNNQNTKTFDDVVEFVVESEEN